MKIVNNRALRVLSSIGLASAPASANSQPGIGRKARLLAFIGVAAICSSSAFASSDFKTALQDASGTLNTLAMVLCFGGLLFAAVMYMAGNQTMMKAGIVGALIAGLAWVIVKTFFGNAGITTTIDISMLSPLLHDPLTAVRAALC